MAKLAPESTMTGKVDGKESNGYKSTEPGVSDTIAAGDGFKESVSSAWKGMQ